MPSEPLASVKMITYNQAAYLAQAIEGVLMQKTGFPYELVIGEDCSTDGTREIALRYAEAHPDIIRMVTSEHNVGTRANGHRTTAACRGKYIAWCEGDDYWHRDDKLQMQVEYLEAHEDCVLVHSDCDLYVAGIGTRIPSYHRFRGLTPPPAPTVNGLLKGEYAIRTCTACARLEAVREILKADPETHVSHTFLMGDIQLWADLMCRGKVHYFSESLSTYRFLPESGSRSRSAVRQQEFCRSAAELRVHLAKKYKLPQHELQKYEARLADHDLFLAFLKQDKELGRSAYTRLPKATVRQRVLYWASQTPLMNGIVKVPWLCKRRLRCKDRVLQVRF